MTSIRAVLVAASVAAAATACTDNSGTHYHPPDQAAVTRSTNAAMDLLGKSPSHGFNPRPVATGHDRADDTGHEVSESATGHALFQIVCAGTGKVTVTIPHQDDSKLVTCGSPAAGFRFTGELTALVVGQRDSTGVYAWRILPKA
jgi:hypothetical protein